MSWLHILVKDRGSTFIVILKTFLQGKLFCFSLWRGSTCKKMESVICCCKYYRSNVLRIALRHLQIPLICRSSHDLDASDKFGYRINQFYLCTHAYSVVMPIRCAPTLHKPWGLMHPDSRWILFGIIHTCTVLPLCRLLSYVSLNRPGKHCDTNSSLTVGLLALGLCGIKA